jgi:hypothetical protein
VDFNIENMSVKGVIMAIVRWTHQWKQLASLF